MRCSVFLSTVIVLYLAFFTIPAQALPGELSDNPDSVSIITMTLAQSLDYARSHNNTILKARQELNRARGRKKEGYALAMPRLDLSSRYTKLEEDDIEVIEGSVAQDEQLNLTLSLNQTLYSGGNVGAGVRAARVFDAQALAQHDAVVRDVELRVKQQFYGLLLAQALVGVNQQAVDLFQENLENVQVKYDAGLVAHYELLRARVELANAQPGLIQAQNNLVLAKERLKKTLNLPLESDLIITGTLAYHEHAVVLDELVRTALSCKKEILAQQYQLDLQRENLISQKSEYFPKLEAFVDYAGNTKTAIGGSADVYDMDYAWSMGVRAEMNLFAGFGTKGRVIQARAQVEQAAIDLADLKQQVELDVRSACYNLEEARQIIASQRENVASAEEGVRQAKERADRGLITQFEYRDTQLSLTQARTNLSQALHDYNVALFALENAVGVDLVVSTVQ